ncbi:hypothetical protein P8C59_008674 [Phyllachora maydis]|uniref:Transcription factor spt8 beta-propeller domain-containing protein n=1 Tax=Phyllachora maydis TaxID=1825666 RepID=A0AAD9ICN4_9PEZI|nr:hypothetical protein P8C59_008674 [Phyllachora maydis]
MDDDEHESGSSDNEQEETMDDGDEMDVDNEADAGADEDEMDNDNEVDNEEDDEENEADPDQDVDQDEADVEADADADADADESHDKTGRDGRDETGAASVPSAGAGADGPEAEAGTTNSSSAKGKEVDSKAESPPSPSQYNPLAKVGLRPRPEAVTARNYDVIPTIAAPQSTSINAISITPDMRYFMTGGSDGYIRKYDGIGSVNGKQLLTVAQRHPFVDSVVKAGILMSYWGNEEPSAPTTRAEDKVLSPVYSLAVHSDALWLLSGLESGCISLQSVRHDEGKRIHVLKDGHTNTVSVLQLAPDEHSVLSGGWDKNMLDWSLDTGDIIRRYPVSGGQISAIEPRPECGAPIPAAASQVEVTSDTMTTNNDKPFTNAQESSSLFGPVQPPAANGLGETTSGSPEHESLFGSPAGSLFGDTDTMVGAGGDGGGGAFGNDDDVDFSGAMDMMRDDSAQQAMHDGGASAFGLGEPPDGGGLGAAASSQAAPGGPAPSTVASQGLAADQVVNGDAVSSNLDSQTTQVDPTLHGSTPVPPGPAGSVPATYADGAPAPSQDAQEQEQEHPAMVFSSQPAPAHMDSSQSSANLFLSAAMDGNLRIWDRRVANPVARISNRPGVPPWCMGACWSTDGNRIFVGRRNAVVEEFSIHKACSAWQPERALKFPGSSGSISCVRPMANGRHLMCASYDILRLYDLQDPAAGAPTSKHASTPPFTIVPGPPRAGVISAMVMDPTHRIMFTAAGHRGWEGSTTEVLIGYEINPIQ